MMLFSECMAELQAFSFHGLSRGAVCDVISAAARLRAAVESFEARAATAICELGDGGPGASSVLRSAARCSQREADHRAERAAGLALMPHVADALGRGSITIQHADALIRASEATSPESVEMSTLLGRAANRPADLFAREVRDWIREHQEPSDSDDEQGRRREARGLKIFDNRFGMTVIHGEVDSICGAQLRAVLEGEADQLYKADGGRNGGADARSSEQRLADALVELLLGGGRRGDDDSGVRRPVLAQMIVLVHADGSAEIPGSGPVPPAELARLACNSDFYGVLFSGNGAPLWHGRRVRLATDAQWRSLIARDRGCVACGAAPSRCEAHHLVPWSRGGATNLDAMALICSHHHHLVHDFGYRLRRRRDGSWSLDPPAGARQSQVPSESQPSSIQPPSPS